ncbi:MAG TPA: IS21 family transposase [Steroidobacteraceae bacterium]|nr:IS21 family transposase [Steroidobacteraceae bacterium]
MATERLPMRKALEILRMKWELRLSNRQVARSAAVSPATVVNVVRRARAAGVTTYAQAREVGEVELEAALYPESIGAALIARPEPNCAWIHRERSRPGVTLQLLHLEYLEANPGGYQYTAFCDRYREFLKRRGLVMRQHHVAGDKMFVDYSGQKPTLVDPVTGEVIEVELFVAVLGASSYTYAEATYTQKVTDFVASHVRAFEFFGGVARAMVPDNLKSGVTRACFYEPMVQRSYEHMALHYGTAVLPAHKGKPKHKAKVEVGVQVAQRWILARLRNRVFHTLAALNEAIAQCLSDLNRRRMREYGKSRLELFETLERSALLPLPTDRYEITEWKKATVNIDYHVAFGERVYSVPHRYLGEEVWICATATMVEVQLRGRRIALHARHGRDRHSTVPEHMPSAHRQHAEWTPSRILSWAATLGPSTRALCSAILAERPHPEQGFRSCLGILRLAKKYGNARVENACARCFAAHARSYRSVESVLKLGLDSQATLDADAAGSAPIDHENVRGPDYFVN